MQTKNYCYTSIGMKKILLIFILTIARFVSFGQDCNENYFDAALDTNYLNQSTQKINKQLSLCTIPNIQCDTGYNSPISIVYLFTIKMTCEGEIISVLIANSKFEYVNAKGVKVNGKPKCKDLETFENCLKTKLFTLKNIKPLIVNGEAQNTEISGDYGLTGL